MSTTTMTCEEFELAMMDELYGELDAATSDRMAEHAATCAACPAKLAKLRSTRSAIGSLEIAPPDDMEARILAAAAAAEAREDAKANVAPSNVVALPVRSIAGAPPQTAQAAKPEAGAKVFAFLSKPQLAAAAVVVLVLGAAAFTTLSVSMKREAAPSAAAQAGADNAPAASAALTPVPMAPEPAPGELGNTATAAPTTVAESPAFAAAPMASAASGPLAIRGAPPSAAKAAAVDEQDPWASKSKAPLARAPAGAAAAPAAKPMPAEKPADGDGSFDAARKLAEAGRCAEALPKLEALAPSNPQADLLAARCVARTRGCVAANSRYDTVTKRNAGTETGAVAALEKQQCQASLDQAEAKAGAGTPSTTHAKPAKRPATEVPAASPPPAATATQTTK